ncbi:uncharacterized protein LOC128234701 isoform X2 [Mya arenaria]|uniref:uncharacterized protein LOC128234701 isoform X2 n=1 Tax=Mya arenaria TaxID=6604 RepID=UPI0022E6D340|nr:uncharacterized protein LOC128234701 isoform X2 [Mya arenaria]XP_052805077.1 uncharacterized protein LOC128234701 isoform X2 [Mya arenaria]
MDKCCRYILMSVFGCLTLYLNATSPVDIHPNMKLIVKCFVEDCHVTEQWTFRWEDENKTEIKTCKQTEECLFTLNYTEDEEMTYICIAWKSDELLSISLTVLNTITEEAATNPELDVTQHWYMNMPVIYVVSGTSVVFTLATLTGLLCRRCKHHEYHLISSSILKFMKRFYVEEKLQAKIEVHMCTMMSRLI